MSSFDWQKNNPRKRKQKSEHSQHKKIDKTLFLRRCSLFSTLSDWEIRSISKLTRLVEFKKDEYVFKTGEEGKAFYLVISGSFEAYLGPHEKKEVLAYLTQGSHFGEMSLISGDPHSASVIAKTDSLVLEIAKDKFKQITQNNASIALEISRVLSKRLKAENLREPLKRKLLRSDIISVRSIRKSSDPAAFSVNLAASLVRETRQKVILIDMSPTGREVSDALHLSSQLPKKFFQNYGENINQILSEHLIHHESGFQVLNLASPKAGFYSVDFIIHLMNRLAVDYRFLVIDLPNQTDNAAIRLMHQSDYILLSTDNNLSSVTEVQDIIKSLDQNISAPNKKVKVVMHETVLGFTPTEAAFLEYFKQKDCFLIPKHNNTTGILAVLDDPDSDFARTVRRIARKLSNNLIGVALGSGAALGFAHVGVLKVLQRENIPIDYISGSSMGALVASYAAAGFSVERMMDIIEELNLWKLASLADIDIFPLRGLIVGKRLVKFFEKHLKDLQFENTKIPLIIVGTDVHNRIVRVMNSGSIVKALRASIAIPGIFHPTTVDGNVLTDGGVLDPLPIKPLIDSGVDKIIAVDVLPTPKDITEQNRFRQKLVYKREALITEKNIFVKMGYGIQKKITSALTPNFIDIVVNSMQAMEHEIAEAVADDADVLIRPSMPHISWVEFHRAKELVQKGEEAAELMIDDLKSLVAQQNI